MEMKLSKEQTCRILECYYKEQEDIIGRVTINEKTGSVGYGMTEYVDCVLDMKIKGEIEFDGIKMPVEEKITTSKLELAISYFIAKTGRDVKSISLDKGTSVKTTGYGMCERDIKTAYFNGINITIENKTKKL